MNPQHQLSKTLSTDRYWVRLLALTLGYTLLGKLGLMLAIAPGYASAFFPAAGLAVAAILLAGNRLLPGIWLGSFLLNLWGAFEHGNLTHVTTLVAASIATGSTLQVWLAVTLIRRSRLCRDLRLEDERSIFRFLFLAGPLSCLISATWGVSALLLGGLLPASMWLFSWWNWYVGDILGVLIFTPLALMLLRRQDELWAARLRTMMPLMLAISMGIVALFHHAAKSERAEIEHRLQEAGQSMAVLLRMGVTAHEEVLSSLSRLLTLNPRLSHDEFQKYVEVTLDAHPDIQALSWNPVVSAAERARFEVRMAQQTGLTDYHLTEHDDRGELIRAASRAEYVPVGWIAPLGQNLAALGFDIASDPVRKHALTLAQTTGHAIATGPIHLVQASTDNDGFLLVSPIYSKTQQLQSYAVGIFKLHEMIEQSIAGHLDASLLFQLNATGDADAHFYRSNGQAPSPSIPSWTTAIPVNGQHWQLSVSPTLDYLTEHRPLQAWLVLAVGLSLASLLQFMLLAITGRSSSIQRRVNAQTLELQESESRFRNMANAAPVLIWVAGMDKQCFWFNQSWLDFTGRSMEQEMCDAWAEGVHPADLRHCMETYLDHFDRRAPFLMEGTSKNPTFIHQS